MTPEAIQSFCIAGTEAYLQFLTAEGRGEQVIDVRQINPVGQGEPACFKLILQARVFSPEMVFLRLSPPRRDFGPKDFTVVEYDADAKCLLIEVRTPHLDLGQRPAGEVKVVSDLRFLVRNVRDWFEQHGGEVGLPPRRRNDRESRWVASEVPLDTGQQEAVGTLLANPLTYVWGPPGTGKTHHVLAAAVVGMVLADRKVGIYAPTNNALEQAMAAVILAAERQGLERCKFLRVGSPSAAFAHKFAEVCEMQGLQGQIEDLRRQRSNYLTTQHHRRGATVLHSVAMLQHEIGQLRAMLERRSELGRWLAGGFVAILWSTLKGERQEWEVELTALEQRIQGQLEMIRRTGTESEKLNRVLAGLDFTNLDATAEGIATLEAEIQHYRERTAAIAAEHEALSEEELRRRIAELEQRIEQLRAHALDERIRAASVIGMTLDCHIGRFLDQCIEFDHVFLDEAGYAPVVKALTLLRRAMPVTFIGDHKQLGPVFEMKDQKLGLPHNHAAIVWKKSALFVDDLFAAESAEALVRVWFKMPAPQLRGFAKGHLRKTFRFGQNLTAVLAECVYAGLDFVSAAPHANLRITCLHAVPARPPAEGRQNQAETDCIAHYLASHPEFGDGAEGAWVILTPYKKQVALLGHALPDARREDRIMVIHKAQGREWDTVFLSVADGRFKSPWFTDTTSPQSGGLHVMNTAASRARKHLILVCDRQFWEARPEQLIARLLSLAQAPNSL